jgi:hypothetical protein
LILQFTPDPAGRSSFILALNAVPVPAALLLLAVIVKPIVVPVGTGVASAVFTTLICGGGGGFTTILAVDLGKMPPLPGATAAVFV